MTGSDLGGAFGGLGFMLVVLIALAFLGVWKLVEIVAWLIQHVKISIA